MNPMHKLARSSIRPALTLALPMSDRGILVSLIATGKLFVTVLETQESESAHKMEFALAPGDGAFNLERAMEFRLADSIGDGRV